MLKVNERELITTSSKPALTEGRLNYRVIQRGKSKPNFKEFWFKLLGNLLFYFNLNSHGGIKGNEPIGFMVLENMTADLDDSGEALFGFTITFLCESDKKHVFSCSNMMHSQQWVSALRKASYENLQLQRRMLEERLEGLTGKAIFPHWKSNATVTRRAPEPPGAQARLLEVGVGPKSNTFISHITNVALDWGRGSKSNTTGKDLENLIKF